MLRTQIELDILGKYDARAWRAVDESFMNRTNNRAPELNLNVHRYELLLNLAGLRQYVVENVDKKVAIPQVTLSARPNFPVWP